MNFALILFILVVATGLVWALDHFHARRKRAPDAPDPWWVECWTYTTSGVHA